MMNPTDLCINIVDVHLEELGIKRDCIIEFFPSERKRVLFPENVLGVYRGAENTAYVRITSLPIMIETLAHEIAHSFLLKSTKIGKELLKHDIIINMHNNGEVSTQIGEEYKALYMISRFVNEGFATFVGMYVLKRFAQEVSSKMILKDEISKEEFLLMENALSDLTSLYEGREFDYYYGKLEFDRIASIFGIDSARTAALASMNVSYSISLSEALKYYEYLRGKIYSKPDLSEPNLNLPAEFYAPIPNFRLLVFSRILPNYIDPIFNANKEYFLNLVRNTIGGNFIDMKVYKHDLMLPLNTIKFGYLLGEYENSRDLSVFEGYKLPKEIEAMIKYGGLDVKTLLAQNRNIYIGYLFFKLRSASSAEAEDILKKLYSFGLLDYKHLLGYLEYGDKRWLENMIKRYLEE